MTLYSEILRQSGTADIQTHYQYPASQKSKGQSQVDADETLSFSANGGGHQDTFFVTLFSKKTQIASHAAKRFFHDAVLSFFNTTTFFGIRNDSHYRNLCTLYFCYRHYFSAENASEQNHSCRHCTCQKQTSGINHHTSRSYRSVSR